MRPASLWILCLLGLIAMGCSARRGPSSEPSREPTREPSEPSDPNLYLRVGRKGEPAFYERGVRFEGQTLRRTFQHGGGAYSLVIRERPAGGHSMYKIQWEVVLSRGADRQEKELERALIGNPKEDDAGGCVGMTDYERNGGLWIEVAFKGKAFPPKNACVKLPQP